MCNLRGNELCYNNYVQFTSYDEKSAFGYVATLKTLLPLDRSAASPISCTKILT